MIDTTDDFEVARFVRLHYLVFLDREPDHQGFQFYVNKIKSGEIKSNDLSSIFTNSEEYSRLKLKYVSVEKVSPDLESILKSSLRYDKQIPSEDKIDEPENIFISCYNEDTREGGIFLLHGDLLKTLSQTRCSGLYYDKSKRVLLGVALGEPQIIAYRIHNDGRFEKFPVRFSNYVFAEDVHGVCIRGNKIIVVASNGQPESEAATVSCIKDGNKVGKIIVSEIEFNSNDIIVKNSKIYNPFDCSHHHHINDICDCSGTLYLSSLSYCDQNQNYIEKGAISRLDSNYKATVITDKLVSPHSLVWFRNRLYICSSANATVLSLDLAKNELRLEYKGLNAFTRGMLITDQFFYIGYSFSMNRTNSRFTNPTFGIIKFDRNTGETTRFELPASYNNVYSIT